jgi:hypothetical protein
MKDYTRSDNDKTIIIYKTRKSGFLLNFVVFFIFISLFLAMPILADTPVSLWKLDDNVLDMQLLNNGTRYNFTDGYGIGKIGNALTFDSSQEQYVDFGNTSSLNFSTNNFSVEFWMKTNNTGINIIGKTFIDETLGWNIMISSSNINFYMIDSGLTDIEVVSTGINVADDLWHHIVAIKTSAIGYLYIDGIQNANNSDTLGDIDNSYELLVGCFPSATGDSCDSSFPYYFNGTLDNIRLWNRSLNDTEIAWLYANDTLPFCTPITVYGNWSSCANSSQYRNITDGCGLDTNETRVCYEGGTSSVYCFSNDTLITADIVLYNGVEHNLTTPVHCDNGCDNVTNSCAPAEYETGLINLAIVVLVIIAFAILYRWARSRR